MMDFPDVSRARRPGFWTTLALGARMMMRDARAGELRLLVLELPPVQVQVLVLPPVLVLRLGLPVLHRP